MSGGQFDIFSRYVEWSLVPLFIPEQIFISARIPRKKRSTISLILTSSLASALSKYPTTRASFVTFRRRGSIWSTSTRMCSTFIPWLTSSSSPFAQNVSAYESTIPQVSPLIDSSLVWQKLHKPIWKDHKTTFNHIAESLSLHASKIQGYGKAFRDPDSYRTGAHERRTDSGIDPNPALNPRQVNEDISNYHVALNKLREEFEETEKKRKREMKNSTIAWISSSTKIEKLQDDFRRMRICKNTGRWLFRRNRGVSEWLTAEGGNEGSLSQSAIWLHGNRGFGKCYLIRI